MNTSDRLDCVIVGPHEMEFDSIREKMWTMGEQSGAYRVLKTNTTVHNGRRMPYFEMLNQMLGQATGSPSNLHVCHLPSLAVSHLKTFLHGHGLRASEVNFFTAEKTRLIDLLAQEPNAVAITTTFYVDNDATTEIVRFIRERDQATKIIIGGPHVLNIYNNYDAAAQDFIFKTIGADIYICDSQGEHTLCAVLSELREQAPDLSRVPNLVYTTDQEVFHRTQRVIENNPIEASVVDWSLFDTGFYAPTVQMRTARSCSFSCAFCQYPSLGGPLSLNSIEFIESQLRIFQEAGVENVVFIDDTFNVPLPRFKKICRMMISNKFNLNWFSFFRCSNSDDEAFDLMASSGCKGVFLGLESGDNTILRNMHKSASAERYRNGIKKLTDRGIFTFASLIAGFPGETRETMNNTIGFITETAPTFYRAELYYHYTSVPIHQEADKYGLVGNGYHWRHNTMGWEEASELIEHMYRTIGSSIVVPGYMFDFWSIPYLLGMGMTMDHVKAFTRHAQDLMVRNL